MAASEEAGRNNSVHSPSPSCFPKELVSVVYAGTVSGCCSCVLLQPLDLVKTRMQVPSTHIRRSRISFVKTFGQVVKGEGVHALWKGLTPSLMRMVPGVSLYFLSLYWLQNQFSADIKMSAGQNLVFGVLSRVLTGMAVMPATVLKVRLESSAYRYSGVYNAFRSILRTDGWKSFFTGVVPTVVRDAPFSGIYLMFYRKQTAFFEPEKFLSRIWGTSVRFICGLNAGVVACLLTHPFDMIKTRMQLFPQLHRTSISAVRYIYQNFGYRGFLTGFVPRATRRTLMAAISWTVFEEILLGRKNRKDF